MGYEIRKINHLKSYVHHLKFLILLIHHLQLRGELLNMRQVKERDNMILTL